MPSLDQAAFVIALVVSWCWFTSASPAAQPAAPVVAETDQQIQRLERRLKITPHDLMIRHDLARAYFQKTRENGDASYLDRAEQLLAPSLKQEQPSFDTLILSGWLALFKHDFTSAAEWAERVRLQRPDDSRPYGILSDAYLEMGEYGKAVTFAQRMVDLKPDQGSYSRAAHLRSIHGDSAGAVELWKFAIAAGTVTGESTAWCKVELGDEYFNRGQVREAELAYTSSLDSFPNYHRGLVGLAKVRVAQERWDDAVLLDRKAIEVFPSPQYIAALGDLYLAMGQPDKAEEQYRLVEQIAKLDELNQVQYNRDLALFYADRNTHLDDAVRLAKKELDVRQDIYSYDILAWTLYRKGLVAEAQSAMKRALRLHTQDARLFFHAGMIAEAAGQRRQARHYLAQALSLNAFFHPLHRKTAEATRDRLVGRIEP